ncbi:MAG: thioredoxin family protein [Candidatus Jordarchaeaceae archaeon]
MIIIELFYSKNCPYCPVAKRMVEESVKKLENLVKECIIVNEINVDTKEGRKKAALYQIQGVPTIAINGAITFVGVPPSTDALVAAIKKFVDGTPIYV